MSLIGHLRVVSSQIASAESRTLFPVVAEKQSHGLSGPLRDPRALGFSQQCCFPFLLEEETNEASASFPLSNGCSAKAHPLQCLPEHLRREGQWKAWGGGVKTVQVTSVDQTFVCLQQKYVSGGAALPGTREVCGWRHPEAVTPGPCCFSAQKPERDPGWGFVLTTSSTRPCF